MSFDNIYNHKSLFYLKCLSTDDNSYSIIPFKNDKVLIGRSKDCSFIIYDETVSRNHAYFRKVNDCWMVKNLSSSGTLLDEDDLPKDEERIINVGQTIQFGSPKFTYRFSVKEIKSGNGVSSKRLGQQDIDSHSEEVHCKSALMEQFRQQIEDMQKKHELEKAVLQEHLDSEERRRIEILREKEEIAQKIREEKAEIENAFVNERKELEQKLSEEKNNLECKLSSMQTRMSSLLQEIEEKDLAVRQRIEEQRTSYEEQKRAADDLASEKETLERRLAEVEQRLDCNALVTDSMARELAEKRNIEVRLKGLENEKTDLEEKLKIVAEKDLEVQSLKENLDLLNAQKMSLEQELSFKSTFSDSARKEVLEDVSNLVENEFQCPICNELFITAIMLNCSHTFCQFCLNSWKKNKKTCPNCRAPIVTETRSLVVDNFIEKIVSTLSEETKKLRSQVITDRRAEEENQRKAAEIARQESLQRGRGRGRNRRGRGRGRGTAPPSIPLNNPIQSLVEPVHSVQPFSNALPHPLASMPDVINVPSDSSSSSESSVDRNFSDSSSVSGDSDVYYGGYGRCFNCGRRGHWANGCPDL